MYGVMVMLVRFLLAAILLAAIGSVLMSRGAAAKGPFEVVISQGDLASDVVIPVKEIEKLLEGHGFFPATIPGRPAPVNVPEVRYRVGLYQVVEDGERTLVNSFVYYPAHGDEEARFQDDEGWYAIDPAFETLLERYIEAAPHQAAASGNDGPSQIWYIAPSLAAGAVLLVIGGAAGRRLLRRLASG
jgi:hypothetical protein